jgi:hypothetical protein
MDGGRRKKAYETKVYGRKEKEKKKEAAYIETPYSW